MKVLKRKFLLYEISWPEAKKYFSENKIAILPVGSTEQHGPHNPLGTDHLIAKAIAEKVAEKTEVICLPVIPFGISGHHRQFWGTIWVKPETLRNYVRDVCLSLKYYGVEKIIVINGHGGNTSALVELAREVRKEGIFMVVFQWWLLAGKLFPGIFNREERGHAGAEETSLNLALYPHLVDMEKAVDEKPSWLIKEVEGLNLPLDTIDYTKSGVFGISKTASKEKGEKILEAIINKLVEIVKWLKRVASEELASKDLADLFT